MTETKRKKIQYTFDCIKTTRGKFVFSRETSNQVRQVRTIHAKSRREAIDILRKDLQTNGLNNFENRVLKSITSKTTVEPENLYSITLDFGAQVPINDKKWNNLPLQWKFDLIVENSSGERTLRISGYFFYKKGR